MRVKNSKQFSYKKEVQILNWWQIYKLASANRSHTTELESEELLLKSKHNGYPKITFKFELELEFARTCQWDFVSFIFIFQFAIQWAQFQHVDLSRKSFDSLKHYSLGILTHAKTIGDCVKRVISYHSGWLCVSWKLQKIWEK